MEDSDNLKVNINKLMNQTKMEWKKSTPLRTYSKVSPTSSNDSPGDTKSRYGRTQKPRLSNDFLSTDKAVSQYLKIKSDNQMHYLKTSPASYQSPKTIKSTPSPKLTSSVEKRGRGRPRKIFSEEKPKSVITESVRPSKKQINVRDLEAPAPTSTETLPLPIELQQTQADQFEIDDADDNLETDELVIGDLAWASIGGFPYWPCAITKDPETLKYTSFKNVGRSKEGREFLHVRFFGDNGQRSWVAKSNTMPYLGVDHFEAMVGQFSTPFYKKTDLKLYKSFTITAQMRKMWQAALSEAESLRYSPRSERLQYFANICSAKKTESEDSPPSQKRKNEDDDDEGSARKKPKVKTPNLKNPTKAKTDETPKLVPRKSFKSETVKIEVKEEEEQPSRPRRSTKEEEEQPSRPRRSTVKPPETPKSSLKSPKRNEETPKELKKTEKKPKKYADKGLAFYIYKNFDQISYEHPDYSDAEIDKFLERQWSQLTAAEKNNYRKSAQNEKFDKNGKESDESEEYDCESRSQSPQLTVVSTIKAVKRGFTLFAGVKSEKVCNICFKGGEIVKCRGPCNLFMHVECSDLPRFNQNHSPRIFGRQDSTYKKKKKKRKSKISSTAKDDDNEDEDTDSGEKEEKICNGNKENNIDDIKANGEIKVESGDEEKSEVLKKEEISKDESSEEKITEEKSGTKLNSKDEPSEEKSGTKLNSKDKPSEEKITEDKLGTKSNSKEVKEEENLETRSNSVASDSSSDSGSSAPSSKKNKNEEISDDKKSKLWMCKLCSSGKDGPCFVCGDDKGEITKCSYSSCKRTFHQECLSTWPQTQTSLGNGKFTCPHHVCHTCISDNPSINTFRYANDKLVRCVKCPSAYHYGNYCVPAGSEILSSTQIICPRHYVHTGKGVSHLNAAWCFLCAIGGSLICCDLCPNSFHAECLKITPPEGDFICEDCETGRYPLFGEIVWVKLGNYRWWPAKILFPHEIPDNIRLLRHQLGEFAVEFFGSHNYYWVNRGRVFLYHEGDSDSQSLVKNRTDKLFSDGVAEAAEAFKQYMAEKADREASRPLQKPPKYIKIQTNKNLSNIKNVEIDASSTTPCECDPKQKKPCGPDSNCLNRLLLVECNPQTCPAGDKCCNQNFEKRLYPNLIPYKTDTRGWGLKTLSNLKKGDFVIEYVGEVIDEQEYQSRLLHMQKTKSENYYFLTIDRDRMLDAGPKGNLARFMNHSCDPNCETQKWTVNGNTRVGIFTLKDIPANTELVFNYNLETIGNNKVECNCGSANCAKYIGEKPIKLPNEEKKVKVPVKKKKVEKRKSKMSFASKVTEDACFTCGEGGELLLCNRTSCPKVYHLRCLGLTKHPADGWTCPWHQCSICSKTNVQRCSLCINSYCQEHAKSNISLNKTHGLLCFHHTTDSGSDSERGELSDDEDQTPTPRKRGRPRSKNYSRSKSLTNGHSS